MTTQADLERAREIIESLIHYDGWRDNLHVNDFPVTRANIAQALAEERERCAKVAETPTGIISTAESAGVKIAEQRRIAKAIRALNESAIREGK